MRSMLYLTDLIPREGLQAVLGAKNRTELICLILFVVAKGREKMFPLVGEVARVEEDAEGNHNDQGYGNSCAKDDPSGRDGVTVSRSTARIVEDDVVGSGGRGEGRSSVSLSIGSDGGGERAAEGQLGKERGERHKDIHNKN